MRPTIPLALCAASLLPAPARGAVVVADPAEHAELIASFPGAGVPWTATFEGFGLGAVLVSQLAAQGLWFDSPVGVWVLPEAFGTGGRGSRLAVVGYDPLGQASVTLWFQEPQFAVAAWLVDVEGPLQVEGWLDGELVEVFVLDPPDAPVAGGAFRGIWFLGQVDAVTFRSDRAEDGFGIDDLSVALLGTVDNDGDGWSDADGDCDDFDPSVSPGSPALCGGTDLDCDGAADDLDGDGFDACDGDCDDEDEAAHPGAVEECDGRDGDCDGLVDESPDGDADGWTVCEGDCDDGDAAVFPGQGCAEAGDDDDASGDDDAGSGDDDDASGDDDAGSGDDDDASGDDDAGSGDDDDASGDDDDAGSGDDDDGGPGAGDDDDAGVGPGGFRRPGLAGGGCGCAAGGGGVPAGLWVPLMAAMARRRRRCGT